jgi:hypothetical protein
MNDQTLRILRSLRPADAARVDALFPSEFRIELLGAIAGDTPLSERGGARTNARRYWSGLRGSRWRAVPIVLLVLLGAAAVAYASGLISFGTPATSVPVFANPRAGLGEIAPGTVHLVPISAPDPRSGPPWGMRVISTTRGAGCLQVGRLLDGKLVALGQDGAFGNDGRAHELPLSTNIERLNCSLLDGRGRIFDSVTIKSQAASAAPGVHCEPPGTYPPSHGPTPATCPLADERNLYYGMLGPDARSLTYYVGGQARTVATVGPDGAYLIITNGTTHRYTGAAGARERAGLYTSDDVPVYSPITAIHYQGGATCHLVTAEQWIYGPRACSPPLPEPYGYVRSGTPTRAQLAAPIHARLIRGAGGRWEIRVSFASRVAISSLRGEYELRLHEPGTPREADGSLSFDPGVSYSYSGMIPQTPNIKAGQILTATIGRFPGPPSPGPGITSGSVILRYADGPLIQAEEDTVSVPVGTFKIRIP